MDKVTMGQVFLEVLGLAHASITHLCSVFIVFISYQQYMLLVADMVIK
jgi:hypothetical protein